MATITEKEKEIAIKIFKDTANHYNANSISKEIRMTRVGAYKALKKLEKIGILESKRLGKAIFYKTKLDDDYAVKHIELFLMEEAKQKPRWQNEFKEISKLSEAIIIFGSILKSEEKAKDIDILIILKLENNKKINQIIKLKNQILTKKIHPLKQTSGDFVKNINKKDKVLLSAIKEGIILSGFETVVDLIKNETNRQQNQMVFKKSKEGTSTKQKT
ncbi:MAG: nucleotidyltransferase domain-containing protein [archaeon]